MILLLMRMPKNVEDLTCIQCKYFGISFWTLDSKLQRLPISSHRDLDSRVAVALGHVHDFTVSLITISDLRLDTGEVHCLYSEL
jgi:hypothetical protein